MIKYLSSLLFIVAMLILLFFTKDSTIKVVAAIIAIISFVKLIIDFKRK